MNEKEIIEILEELKDKYISSGIAQFSILELDEDEKQAIEGLLDLYNKEKEENKELEKYKRLAKANLKDADDFKNNMCEHRCIKYNEILELKSELQKKDKIINEMAEVLNDFDYDKQCEICHTDICSASVDGTEYMKCIIEYFTNKVEEDKG